jgi:hypothetical protein
VPALGEGVPDGFAVARQLSVGEHELGAGVDDFDQADPGRGLSMRAVPIGVGARRNGVWRRFGKR